MRIMLSITVATMVMAGGAGARAAELPSFDVAGFPISPVQVQLLGAANVEEQAPVDGMAASPHQIRVLTPRPRPRLVTATIPAATTVGFAAR